MNHDPNQQDWGSATPEHWSLKAAPIITSQNKSVYLTGVWMLGFVSVFSLIGIVWLSLIGREIPQALVALGAVAIGVLGSLFTHSK